MRKNITKTSILIIMFAIVGFLQATTTHPWARKEVLHFDASGYYLFLPATFIYNDLEKLAFYSHIDSVYKPSGAIHNYALYEHKNTRKRSNKYAIGTAIGELPFFLVAHFTTKYLLKNYPADGYSEPYQYSVAMSNLFWSILGLVILSAFLRKYFTDTITAITLLLIGFGTNFYCYTIADQGMSHNLMFLIFAGILYCTERWYSLHKTKHALLLGLLLGWTLITRPVDFVIILIPLFWPIKCDTSPAPERLKYWWQYKNHLMLCMLAFTLVTFIQLSYWKYTAGHFIHFSYEEEGFNFNHPEILNGLFSFRKGWFVYTPIALFGFIGILPLYKNNKKTAWILIVFFMLMIYVVFSWWNWWYGWSFGSRAMIETLAILSIPLAALTSWIAQQKRIVKGLGICIGFFLIWLNLYQTEQYRHGTIHGDKMTKQYYWAIWNKMHASPEDWKLLEN